MKLQASITNATVIWNTAQTNKRSRIKEFVLEVSKYYLARNLSKHIFEKGNLKKYCSMKKCEIRSMKYCIGCDTLAYYCDKCFKKIDENNWNWIQMFLYFDFIKVFQNISVKFSKLVYKNDKKKFLIKKFEK